jgi:hypothetical protein
LSTKFDRTCARNSDFWATVIRDLGPALQLFRIESERLKLSAPFNRPIAGVTRAVYWIKPAAFWLSTPSGTISAGHFCVILNTGVRRWDPFGARSQS